ncbi:GMP synthase (glutamine-hydrolyzing) C-terminal domain containing protein [Babesia bovis T2Bo]|uniref:GMP synthase (glutamine-hydrolyzing) n=1 Tax=Babesia bovis TaxID=5865 RepID=A7ARU6_BABBO|nr:GMP synthase (glutamine-hydrolyzing) C-terminal domain containing protein [Babesia bovis T2Bo]EDO07265.1 GMP synthase (glutamine-hydrolyzing) C-terminal domain containing protein [Babesia bovis T2Bo]|eukprot:XP_001610833.1 GMP synthase [Babesia bovis T2Bo]
MTTDKNIIFIFDFGSHQSGSMVRFLRGLGITCELFPVEKAVETLSGRVPAAVILSGGSESVKDADSIKIDKKILEICASKHVPVLALAYAMYALCETLGGKVTKLGPQESEYRKENVHVEAGSDSILEGVPSSFVAHGCHLDKIDSIPTGFKVSMKDAHGNVAGIVNSQSNVRAFCFHPQEVEEGKADMIMKKFCFELSRCEKTWDMRSYHEQTKKDVIKQCGSKKFVVAGLSGGVDSTVCAAIVHEAIKERFHGIMINTGLMRYQETQKCYDRLKAEIPGIQLTIRDSSAVFFKELKGVHDPENKRKVIGRVYIEEFEKAMKELGYNHDNCLLLQGTIYPDILESDLNRRSKLPVKSHHNVGGLPENLKFELIEPVRLLFKEEVRDLGRLLGLSETTFKRHPFPGPGLGARVLGELTPERVEIARQADRYMFEELEARGLVDKVSQCACVLLPNTRSTGLRNSARVYGMVVVVRIIMTVDFVTAKFARHIDMECLAAISRKITENIPEVNRVCYDITDKPPATIEWE